MQFLHAGHRETPRALRIPLQTPLRFRQSGRPEWSQGIAVNISSSGVLLRAELLMEVQTRVQMTYLLPVTIAGRNGITILCKGEIIRTITPAASHSKPQFAVKILEYCPG